MIVFRGLRVGSGAPAMSGYRQAALTPAGGREKRPWGAALQALRTSSRGPCDAPSITADHAPSRRACKAVRCVTLL